MKIILLVYMLLIICLIPVSALTEAEKSNEEKLVKTALMGPMTKIIWADIEINDTNDMIIYMLPESSKDNYNDSTSLAHSIGVAFGTYATSEHFNSDIRNLFIFIGHNSSDMVMTATCKEDWAHSLEFSSIGLLVNEDQLMTVSKKVLHTLQSNDPVYEGKVKRILDMV